MKRPFIWQNWIMSYQLFLLLIISLPNQINGCYGDTWQPSLANGTRDDLLCSCNKDIDDYERCCRCHSCAIWEGSETGLYVEHVSVSGRSLVLSDQALNETEVYKIVHTDSEMTEIPSNLCNWEKERNLEEKYPSMFKNMQQFWGRIVKINFKNNKIRKLPDINCLVRLDELNLRNNKLVYLSNTSFTELTFLRFVDFSGNVIQTMDPGILTSEKLSVFHADFSYNQLEKLDVSNMASLYPFCSIDYQSNKITGLVNEGNFAFNLSKTYGPGFVSCNDNKLSTWPDFERLLHLKDITQLGHLFNFGFDFQNIPLVCDCNIERFMSKAYDIINQIWRDYMNVTCMDPPHLHGIPVVNVDPSRLICPVDDGCDPRCKCVDRPNQHTLFIDCQNSDLEELPEIPGSRFSPYVSLNISGSRVKQIGNYSYLSKISVLDISNNNLLELNRDTIMLLENATYIDISNNPNLRQLLRTFQFHNVCSRHMRNLQISCDCDSLWIEQWLRSKPCVSHSHLFECVVPQAGVKPALSFHKTDLECSPNHFPFFLETIIAGAILLLLIISAPIYIFRYEILILYLRARQRRKGNTVLPLHKYDVFLSFNDTDDIVSDWVYLTLEPKLVTAGYRVFQPNWDVAFGAERDSEIISILTSTRNFLAILSDSYLIEADEGMRSWTENEWKYGWNNFKADRSKNIVLVNFDHVSSFDVDHPQIKAFLPVGCTVDFKNQDRKIMEDIFTKLGKPFKVPGLPSKGFENKNLKFSTQELFTVDCTNQRVYLTDNQLLQGENELPGKDWEQKNTDILTKYHTCNGDISRDNVFKRLRGQKQLKKCQFRKCYACNYVDNSQEKIQNANIGKVSKAYRNSTSRFKLYNQIYSSNKLDDSQDKLSDSNYSLTKEREENMTISGEIHENINISYDQPKTTKVSDYKHENTKISYDQPKTTQISENKHENTKISCDQPKTTKVSEDKHENTKISYDQPKTTKVSEDKQENTKISYDQPKTTKVSEDKHENTKISKMSKGQHENTKMSKGQHENTKMSKDQYENISISEDKVGYQTAYNMHSFPGTEEASRNVRTHAVNVPQETLVTDSGPIQYTNFPENLCVTDLDSRGRPGKLEGRVDEMPDLDNTANLQCLRNSRQCFLQENFSETRSSASSRASVNSETVSMSDISV